MTENSANVSKPSSRSSRVRHNWVALSTTSQHRCVMDGTAIGAGIAIARGFAGFFIGEKRV